MNLETFQSQLHKIIGEDIPQGTLKRWAYDGLIPRPKRYQKGKGRGRGRAASWDRAAIADAAALWAVRNVGGRKLLQSKKLIDVIKQAADIYQGEQYLGFGSTPLLKDPNAPWQSFKIEFTMEYDGDPEEYESPGLKVFPRKSAAERAEVMNPLIFAWICAHEKARKGVSLQNPARVVIHWRPIIAHEVVSDDGKRLLVNAHVFEKTTIEAADHDEIIYCENGVDLRERFYGRTRSH